MTLQDVIDAIRRSEIPLDTPVGYIDVAAFEDRLRFELVKVPAFDSGVDSYVNITEG